MDASASASASARKLRELWERKAAALKDEYVTKVIEPGLEIIVDGGTFQLTHASRDYPADLQLVGLKMLRELDWVVVVDRCPPNAPPGSLPFYEAYRHNEKYAALLSGAMRGDPA